MQMSRSDAVALATRLKRGTTNRDVLALCEFVLSLPSVVQSSPNGEVSYRQRQREYMRDYRARKKPPLDKP